MTQTNPPADGEIASLDAVRRRRHLEQLLDLRHRLAILGVERQSHHLADAWEVAHEARMIEQQIAEQFPDVHARSLPSWVEQEVQAMHSADVLVPGCGICRAIARNGGVNLEPPDAA